LPEGVVPPDFQKSQSGREKCETRKFVLRLKGASMKLIAEYLERAIDFEKMAVAEKDSTLKASLLKQAAARA
jgi:hypothetical protein